MKFLRKRNKKRKHSHRKAVSRKRTLVGEILEFRYLLASNVFAEFQGQVAEAGQTQTWQVSIHPTDFTLAGGKSIIGFHALSNNGSSLKPAAIEVRRVSSGALPVQTSNILNEGKESLNLAELVPGEYQLTVRGADSTTGSFRVESYLVGDANGDRQIDSADATLIRRLYGSRAGDSGYRIAADANLDGRISAYDLSAWTHNNGDSTAIRPLSISTLYASPSPTVLPSGSLLTNQQSTNLQGQSLPNVSVRLTNLANNSILVTTANSQGYFEFPSSLNEGENTFLVSAADRFGQSVEKPFSIVLDKTKPYISATLVNDSGKSATDLITSDPSIRGQIFELGNAVRLKGGFNGQPTDQFIDLTNSIQPNGQFSFDRSRINSIAGGTLADGSHVLHLVAADAAGNTALIDIPFTLDTLAPTGPFVRLSQVSMLDSQNRTASANVTILGTATALASVTLTATSTTTIASGAGDFQFTSVPLVLGNNTFVATEFDLAGNVSSSQPLLIERIDATQQKDVVLQWMDILLSSIERDATTPPFASRAMAMLSTAIYDVVSGIEHSPPTIISLQAPTEISVDAAIASAAFEILSYLYPAQRQTFANQRDTQLLAAGSPPSIENGSQYGRAIATSLIAIRDQDGWRNFVDQSWSTDAGMWQPTAPMFDEPQLPQWANVTPFSMSSPDQFRPAGPPNLDSTAWAEAFNEVKSLGSSTSTARSADQTQIARFWADGAGTVTPPGHWNRIAIGLAETRRNSVSENAKLFAQLNMALADAGIAAWDSKYAYNFWRPITAIGSADSDSNPATIKDSDWNPLLITPPHPEYVSGHSAFSGAAATILAAAFGENSPFTSESPGMPGINRSFSSFQQAAAEASRSRVYGGIHYAFSGSDGLELGRKIASQVMTRFNAATDDVAPQVVLNPATTLVTAIAPILRGQVIDNRSGVASLEVQMDGGPWQPLSFSANGSFTYAPTAVDGTHSVAFRATDYVGNRSFSLSRNFIVDSQLPTLAVFTPTVDSILGANHELSGSVSGTGSDIVRLMYSIDSGIERPIQFIQSTGSFSTTLEIDHLSAGSHSLQVQAIDAAGLVVTRTVPFSLDQRMPLTITELTPMVGAVDVGATYRPTVTFSRAVDASTVNVNSFYLLDEAGLKRQATIVVSDDHKTAWLYPETAMPGATLMTVVVNADLIRDAEGSELTMSGTMESQFTTVSLAPVIGTSIFGTLADPGVDLKPGTFDDERAGPDGRLMTADDLYLNPIVGAKVYILGLENQFVLTDNQGNFRIDSAPIGNVKLVIDGRTATNSSPGTFWPEMVMDLTIRSGQANSVMAAMEPDAAKAATILSTGVHLPRLQTSILKSVSSTQMTTIGVTSDAAPNLPDDWRNQLSISIAPDSLVGENGQKLVNGQLGISTVPAELVREMLPPGVLQHTFDITIQAPGVTTFSTPAPMTFPNVFGAEPGTQLNFLSFDHTTGRLVIDGTATVSADGKSVSTDPGTGIRRPGWHGLTPRGTKTEPPGGSNSCNNDSASFILPPTIVTEGINDILLMKDDDTVTYTITNALANASCETFLIPDVDLEIKTTRYRMSEDNAWEKTVDKTTVKLGNGESYQYALRSDFSLSDPNTLQRFQNNSLVETKTTFSLSYVNRSQRISIDLPQSTVHAYRFIDGNDLKHGDGQWHFPVTLADGEGGVLNRQVIDVIGESRPEVVAVNGQATADWRLLVSDAIDIKNGKRYPIVFDPVALFDKTSPQHDHQLGARESFATLHVIDAITSSVVVTAASDEIELSAFARRPQLVLVNTDQLNSVLGQFLDGNAIPPGVAALFPDSNGDGRRSDETGYAASFAILAEQTLTSLRRTFSFPSQNPALPAVRFIPSGQALDAGAIDDGISIVQFEDTRVRVDLPYGTYPGLQVTPGKSLTLTEPGPTNATYYVGGDAANPLQLNGNTLFLTMEMSTDRINWDVITGAVLAADSLPSSGVFLNDPTVRPQGQYFYRLSVTPINPAVSTKYQVLFGNVHPQAPGEPDNLFLAVGRPSFVDINPNLYSDSLDGKLLVFPGGLLAKDYSASATGKAQIISRNINENYGLPFLVGTFGATTVYLNQALNYPFVDSIQHLGNFLGNVIAHELGHDFGLLDIPDRLDTKLSGDLMARGYLSNQSGAFTKSSGLLSLGLGLPLGSSKEIDEVLKILRVGGEYSYKSNNQFPPYGRIDNVAPQAIATPIALAATSSILAGNKEFIGNESLVLSDVVLGSSGSQLPLFLYSGGGVGLTGNVRLETESSQWTLNVASGGAFNLPAFDALQSDYSSLELPLSIQFQPLSPGVFKNAILIESNDPTNPVIRIPIQGRGISAGGHISLAIDSKNNNFGGSTVGIISPDAQRFTLSNDGTTPLVVTSVYSALGRGEEEYLIGGFVTKPSTMDPLVLQPGESTTFSVRFRPSAAGLRPGGIAIESSDLWQPNYVFPIVGTGISSKVPSSTAFNYLSLSTNNNLRAPIRQTTNENGAWEAFLAENTQFQLKQFDPVSGQLMSGWFTSAGSGATTTIPRFVHHVSTTKDTDGDGLPDDVEFAIGTSPNSSDTDGDGVTDLTSLEQGLNPLGGQALPMGVVGRLSLSTSSLDIKVVGSPNSIDGQIAYIANSWGGLVIVDVTQVDSPRILSRLSFPNEQVESVDFDPDLKIAVVTTLTRTGGHLIAVDVLDPSKPRVLNVTEIGHFDRTDVVVSGGYAYVSDGRNLVSVDLTRTGIVAQLAGTERILSMALDGNMLFLLRNFGSTSRFESVEISEGQLLPRGKIETGNSTGGGGSIGSRDGAIVAGNGLVYVPAASSYAVYDFTDPDAPIARGRGIAGPSTLAIGVNGSGLVMTIGLRPEANSTIAELQVWDGSNPNITNQFVTKYDLPGTSSAGSSPQIFLAGGLAFLLGNSSDVLVMNYGLLDTFGQAPVASLGVGSTDADLVNPGFQTVENSVIRLNPIVSDDVQVRRVDLLENNVVVQTDLSFPFDFRQTVPVFDAESPNVEYRIRVTDMAGNVTLSNIQRAEIVEDLSKLSLVSSTPNAGDIKQRDFRQVQLRFNKLLDVSTVTTDNFYLLDPNGQVVRPLSLTERDGWIETREHASIVEASFPALAPGNYQLVIKAAQVTDRSGESLGSVDRVTPFEITWWSIRWQKLAGDQTADWFDTRNWEQGRVPQPEDYVWIPYFPQLPTGRVVITGTPHVDVHVRQLVAEGNLTIGNATVRADESLDVYRQLVGSSINATVQQTSLKMYPGSTILSRNDAVRFEMTLEDVTVVGELVSVDTGNQDRTISLGLKGIVTLSGSYSNLGFTVKGDARLTGNLTLERGSIYSSEYGPTLLVIENSVKLIDVSITIGSGARIVNRATTEITKHLQPTFGEFFNAWYVQGTLTQEAPVNIIGPGKLDVRVAGGLVNLKALFAVYAGGAFSVDASGGELTSTLPIQVHSDATAIFTNGIYRIPRIEADENSVVTLAGQFPLDTPLELSGPGLWLGGFLRSAVSFEGTTQPQFGAGTVTLSNGAILHGTASFDGTFVSGDILVGIAPNQQYSGRTSKDVLVGGLGLRMNGTLTLQEGLTTNGQFGGGLAVLKPSADVLLSGDLTIKFSENPDRAEGVLNLAKLSVGKGTRLTLAPTVVMRGNRIAFFRETEFTSNQGETIINRGRIEVGAPGVPRAVFYDEGARESTFPNRDYLGFVNEGVIVLGAAINELRGRIDKLGNFQTLGGDVVVQGLLRNAGLPISIGLQGSRWSLSGGRVADSILTSNGSTTLGITAAGGTLLRSGVDNQVTVRVDADHKLEIQEAFALNGLIQVGANDDSMPGAIAFRGDSKVTGSGRIVMGRNASNQLQTIEDAVVELGPNISLDWNGGSLVSKRIVGNVTLFRGRFVNRGTINLQAFEPVSIATENPNNYFSSIPLFDNLGTVRLSSSSHLQVGDWMRNQGIVQLVGDAKFNTTNGWLQTSIGETRFDLSAALIDDRNLSGTAYVAWPSPLTVAGTAQLGGKITANFIDGFHPSITDTAIPLVSMTSSSGVFNSIQFLNGLTGQTLSPVYRSTAFELAIDPAVLRLAVDTAPFGNVNQDRLTAIPTITTKLVSGLPIVTVRAKLDSVNAAWQDVSASMASDGTLSIDQQALNSLQGGILPQGPHQFFLQVEDSRGKLSKTQTFDFVLDSLQPAITVAQSSSTGRFITFLGQVLGTGSSLVSLTASWNSAPATSVTVNLDGNFSHTVDLAFQPGIDGSNLLKLTAVDLAGNESILNYTYSLDLSIAPPAFHLDPAFDTEPLGDNETISSIVDLVGYTDPGASVGLFIATNYEFIVSDTADSNGRFVFRGVPLKPAANRFVARAQDDSGNIAESQTTITRTPDPTSLLISIALENDSGRSDVDLLTNNPNLNAQVSSVQPLLSLEAFLSTASSQVSWSILSDLPADGNIRLNRSALETRLGGTLDDGPILFELVGIDDVFNQTTTRLSFILDSTPPTVPVFSISSEQDPEQDFVVDRGNVDIIMSDVEFGLDVSLSRPGEPQVLLTNGIANLGLRLGVNAFTILATDDAGNQSESQLSVEREVAAIALQDNGDLATEYVIPVQLGQVSGARTIEFDLVTEFDIYSLNLTENDRFNVYLISDDESRVTVLDGGLEGSPIFSIGPDAIPIYRNDIIIYENGHVTIDVSSLSSINRGRIIFQLLGHSFVSASRIEVKHLRNIVDGAGSPRIVSHPTIVPQTPGNSIDFQNWTSGEFEVQFMNQRFNPDNGSYQTEVVVTNNTSRTLTELVVAFAALPSGVSFLNASGFDGVNNYFNFTNALLDGGLRPGESTKPITIKLNVDNLQVFAFPIPNVFALDNSPPTMVTPQSSTIAARETNSISLQANDPDGDVLTYSIVTALPFISLTSDGQLSLSPTPLDVGVYELIISVSDGMEVIEQVLNLEVTAPAENVPPEFLTAPKILVTAGHSVKIPGWANDDDNDPLFYFAFFQYPNDWDGQIAFTADHELLLSPSDTMSPGFYLLTVHASDGIGMVEQQLFVEVLLGDTNQAPYMPFEWLQIKRGHTANFIVVDPDNDAVIVTLAPIQIAGISVTVLEDGTLKINVAADYTGAAQLTIEGELSDGQLRTNFFVDLIIEP